MKRKRRKVFIQAGQDGETGFSLVELLMVVILFMVLVSISVPMVESAIRQARADGAMNQVLTQLRMARHMAVDERRMSKVVVSPSGTVSLAQQDLGGAWTTINQMALDATCQFRLEPGIPTDPSKTPDQRGADSAIDFAGATEVIFSPEGAAIDSAGDLVNGVVYLAVPGYLETARAVTLFGGSGRTRGWWLRETTNGWEWQ